MNLHDFVAEPVNPEHSFHDAHTVPFCLTADHIATCHMFLCPHQVSTVLVCLWTRVVWKVYGTRDDGIWSHSWSPTRMVERLYLWKQDRWVSRQLFTDAVECNVSRRHDSWFTYAVECNVSRGTTVVHGCSGMQRLSAARQLVHGCSGMQRLSAARQWFTDVVGCNVSR